MCTIRFAFKYANMYELNPEYLERLETLAAEIQESEELQKYLEEEEEEYYDQLKVQFEPRIGLIYEEVAAKHPLQLIALELILMDPAFEGLYLPRILGYSVLRGEIDPITKYVRPQDHFKEVVLTIAQSANFEMLKKRIGQSIQIGFALSSDIWVTNLIQEIDNKRVRQFLQSQKQERFRYETERALNYARYARQFRNENFLTAEFPETKASLAILFNSLKQFLLYRIHSKYDNSSLIPSMDALIANEELQGTAEHLELTVIYGGFFGLSDESADVVQEVFNRMRSEVPEAPDKVFALLLELKQAPKVDVSPEVEIQLAQLVDPDIDDNLTAYFTLILQLHTQGYRELAVQEAIKVEINKHEGLSLFNENVRWSVFGYFKRYVSDLTVDQYTDFFEVGKLYTLYIALFANQQFNQNLKELSMRYVRKLLKRYTDKRGKDYQDIKKYVIRTFQDLNFLTEKEVTELFKTRRKRKKAES